MASLPVLRVQHLHLVALQHGWSGRRCCARRRPRSAPSCPASSGVGLVELLQHLPLLRPAGCAATRCRNSAVSSSRRSGERTSLTMIVSASRCSSRLLLRARGPCRCRPRSGSVAQLRLLLDLLDQLEAGHVGQAQVEHHAVEVLGLAAPARASAAGAHRGRSARRRCRSAPRCCCAGSSSSSTTSRRLPAGPRTPAWCRRRPPAPRGPPACAGSRARPACSARSGSSATEMMWTGMWRVADRPSGGPARASRPCRAG